MKVLAVRPVTRKDVYGMEVVLQSEILVLDFLGTAQDAEITFKEREYYTENQLVKRIIELINDKELGGFYGYCTHLIIGDENTFKTIKNHWKKKIQILDDGRIIRNY